VFMMMGHSVDTSHDISSLIGRSMYSAGLFYSAVAKCAVEESIDLVGERWWITSLVQHLKAVDVVLEKNGVDTNTPQDSEAKCVTLRDRQIMCTAGMYSAGELFMEGDDPSLLRDMFLSDEFIAETIANTAVTGPITLRPGPIYWKRATSRLASRVEKGQLLSLNDVGERLSFCTGSGSSEWMPVGDMIKRFDLLLTLSKEVHCETPGNRRVG